MSVIDLARLPIDIVSLSRSQWWSRDRIRAHQQAALLETLRFAVERVPFYRRLGIKARDLHSAADLLRFPVLTKVDVQEHGEGLLAQGLDARRLRWSRSSGMTGEPVRTYFDERTWALSKYALKIRRVLADAPAMGQRVLLVSERAAGELPRLLRLLRPLLAVKQLSLLDDLEASVRALVAFRPTVVYGFPSHLSELAESARSLGIELPRVPVVYTSSEVLSDAMRATLARAFQGRVVDVYGTTEFKEIAVQCGNGRYHVNFETVYVESIPDPEHGFDRLLVTTLINRAMPLIRFELGDTGTVVDDVACACGRQSAQVADLHGRLGEVLAFPDGTKVSGYLLTTAMERFDGVRHYRFVHESPWSVRVETLAQPALAGEELEALDASLRVILPPPVSLRFVALDSRGPYTKRRAVSREF